MAARYWVENVCGGRVYCATLREAMEVADGWGTTPYVHSLRGARPVYAPHDSDGYVLGRFGETLTDLIERYAMEGAQ